MIPTMQMWRQFRDQANKTILNGQKVPANMSINFNKVLDAMREWHKDYEAFMAANKSCADEKADMVAYMQTGKTLDELEEV